MSTCTIPKTLLNKTKITAKDFAKIRLGKSSHDDRSEGVCAMEAASWLAGRAHDDAPVCVHSDLRDTIINLNDESGDKTRQLLKPLVLRCLGTSPIKKTNRTEEVHHPVTGDLVANVPVFDAVNHPAVQEAIDTEFEAWRQERRDALAEVVAKAIRDGHADELSALINDVWSLNRAGLRTVTSLSDSILGKKRSAEAVAIEVIGRCAGAARAVVNKLTRGTGIVTR